MEEFEDVVLLLILKYYFYEDTIAVDFCLIIYEGHSIIIKG